MNTTYTLSRMVTSDGTAEVLVRFYAGRTCDERAHTRIRVPVTLWDAKNGRILRPRFTIPQMANFAALQQRIDNLTSYIYEAYTQTGGNIAKGWLKRIIAEYNGDIADRPRTLVDIIPLYIAAHDLAAGTKAQHEIMYKWLGAFRPIDLQTITADDLDDIEKAMLNGGLGRNTISIRVKMIRGYIKFAIQHGWCNRDPFDTYKIPPEIYGTVYFLTAEERERLWNTPRKGRAAIWRDAFIFQCWVGCRFSDLATFTRENITSDGYLEYIPKKTRNKRGVTVRVPLSPTAMAILSRCTGSGFLFPRISPNGYKNAIRALIRESGIDRRIIVQDAKNRQPKSVWLSEVASSHLARRTFAANAFAATGSERIVASMTGHAPHSSSFLRYTDVTDEMKRHALF